MSQDQDGDGTYEILASFNDCFETCAGGTTSESLFDWDGQDFSPIPPQDPQRCGGLWLGRTDGGEDLVEDITVVGISCYEVYGLDGPPVVNDIASAHTPFSDVREFVSNGYRCTVTDVGFEEQRYRCEGVGLITFRRYARY